MWGISLMNYYYFFYITLCIFTGNKYMLIRRNFTFVFYSSISTQNVVIIQLYRLTYQPNFADFTIKYFTNKLTAKTAQINLVQQYLQFSPCLTLCWLFNTSLARRQYLFNDWRYKISNFQIFKAIIYVL